MTDRYAVIGNPVAHSLSPLIHAEFARQTGEDIEYARLLAPPGEFVRSVDAFREQGGRGLNVTLPFKEEAYRYATDHSTRARDAQAVNTLRFDGLRAFGDNTDGTGLVRDIRENLGAPLSGKSILLLGAGGAARGVLAPLLAERPASLTLANRNLERALALARRFEEGRVLACFYVALAGKRFDLVINATSASLAGASPPMPPGIFAPGSLAYDMMYGKGETPFLARAGAEGAARLCDGLGMLVEQAAESFLVWRGVRPQTQDVLALLRRA